MDNKTISPQRNTLTIIFNKLTFGLIFVYATLSTLFGILLSNQILNPFWVLENLILNGSLFFVSGIVLFVMLYRVIAISGKHIRLIQLQKQGSFKDLNIKFDEVYSKGHVNIACFILSIGLFTFMTGLSVNSVRYNKLSSFHQAVCSGSPSQGVINKFKELGRSGKLSSHPAAYAGQISFIPKHDKIYYDCDRLSVILN